MRWQLASTFAATVMSGCYSPSTIVCETGVYCPEGKACTENDPASGQPLCGDEIEVASCAGIDNDMPCDEAIRPGGYCENRICKECIVDLSICRTEWAPMTSASGDDLSGVWVAAPDQVLAIGTMGLFGYDGRVWTQQPLVAGGYRHVWGKDGDLFVHDADNVYRGSSAAIVATKPDVDATLLNLWAASASDVVVVGVGTVLELTGTSWSPRAPTTVRLEDVWGNDEQVVAVGGTSGFGEGTKLLFRRVGEWTSLDGPTNPVPYKFSSVWFADATDIFVAGIETQTMAGVLWRYRWTSAPPDGTWERQQVAPGLMQINALWGASSSEVYGVGLNGTIVTFDGTAWTTMVTDTAVTFRDIGGSGRDAIAVGTGGAIWRISR